MDLNASPSPIEYVKQVYREYNLDEEGYMDDDDYSDTTSTNYWEIQTKTEYTTTPKVGGSCLRSKFGKYGKVKQDARAARIYFRVYGAGTLNFWYKTSCDDAGLDCMNVWIDGYLSYTDNGYGELDYDDNNWIQYGWKQVNNGEGIEIFGTEDNSEDSYVHEVIIEFYKDAPEYDFDGKYVYEPIYSTTGWDAPVKNDYKNDDGSLDEDSYNSAKTEYDFLTNYFMNCIWLDQLTWEQKPLELSLSQSSEEIFEEIVTIDFLSNVQEFGYHIRYTTDGSAPTVKSTLYDSKSEDSTLVLTETTTVRAAIFGGTINNPIALSNTASIEETFTIRAASPTITIASEQPDFNSVRLQFSKVNSAAKIYYTTNGSEPTTKSSLLGEDGFLSVSEKVMIKAICVRDGAEQSMLTEFNDIECCRPPNVIGTPALPTDNTYYLDDSSSSIKLNVYTGGYTLLISHGNVTEYSFSDGFLFQYTLLASSDINSEIISFRNVQPGKLPSKKIVIAAYRKLTYQFNDSTSEANQFSPGWNLVSFSLKPDEATLRSLKSYPIFEIGDTGAYTPVNDINMNQGYWIYLPSRDNIQLSISGYQIASEISTPNLSKWEARALSKDEFDTIANKWEFINGRFQKATIHKVGRAYFIYSK